MKQHIMLDLETVGTGDGAGIMQIGAVVFDASGVSTSYRFKADIDPGSPGFGETETGTLLWWLKQDPQAIASVFHADDRSELEETLVSFSAWMKGHAHSGVWACGPNFDCRLLNQAYARVGVSSPLRYGRERCFRTLRGIGEGLGLAQPPFDGVVHDALADAVFQATYASTVLSALSEIKLEPA